MTLGLSHFHKERTVINSNYSNEELLSLTGIRQRLESSLAFTRHMDIEHMTKCCRISLTVSLKSGSQ